ncbi:MAG: FG-GAP repeat protein [Deltaproteobacteria bacterium]|nr:FG-GAP repeat protein [Deltaproteobacteria bacterium]
MCTVLRSRVPDLETTLCLILMIVPVMGGACRKARETPRDAGAPLVGGSSVMGPTGATGMDGPDGASPGAGRVDRSEAPDAAPGERPPRAAGPRADLNGDGFDDLVVGAFAAREGDLRIVPPCDVPVGEDKGGVFVTFGSSTGVNTTPNVTLHDPTGHPESGFGSVVAVPGDLDGDGYSDLVVGATRGPRTPPEETHVYLYRGSPTGPPNGPTSELDLGGAALGGRLGMLRIVGGDLNGDGIDDLVLIAHRGEGLAPPDQLVLVYLGASAGLGGPGFVVTVPADAKPSLVGTGLASGDLDDDGRTELLLGDPGSGAEAEGAVFVYGLRPPGTPTPLLTIAHPQHARRGCLGWRVDGGGDINGDGWGDVATAASCGMIERSGGSLFVFAGTPGGVAPAPLSTAASPFADADTPFATVVAARGDLDGDGHADLVASGGRQGAEGETAPRVFVYYGGTGGIPAKPDIVLTDPRPSFPGAFGSDLRSTADFNADGREDLVVADNGYSCVQGAVYVYLGRTDRTPRPPDVVVESPMPGARIRFGCSLAP